GKFAPLTNQWKIFDQNNQQLGIVKPKFFSFSKKYTYTRLDDVMFFINAPALSRDFTVYYEKDDVVATFIRMNGFFSSASYEIHLHSSLEMEELIAVVMGVNAIEKRKRSSSANSS